MRYFFFTILFSPPHHRFTVLTMLLSCNGKNSMFSLNSFQQAQKDHLTPPGAGRITGLKRSSVHLPGRQKRLKNIHRSLHVHWDPQQPKGAARIQKEFFSQKERKGASLQQLGTGLAACKYSWLLLMLWQFLSEG